MLGTCPAPLVLEHEIGDEAGPDAETQHQEQPLLRVATQHLTPGPRCARPADTRTNQAGEIEDDEGSAQPLHPSKAMADKTVDRRIGCPADRQIDLGKSQEQSARSQASNRAAPPQN